MEKSTQLIILIATSPFQLQAVKMLIRSFVSWHRNLHLEDLDILEKYIDPKGIEEELSYLPGQYASPRGRLLLATLDGSPAGVIALRELDEHTCEMKRMFVYDEFQRKGIGKALVQMILQEAKEIGYQAMRLDASFRQKEAISFYEKMGFQKISAYYSLAPELVNWLVFMERRL